MMKCVFFWGGRPTTVESVRGGLVSVSERGGRRGGGRGAFDYARGPHFLFLFWDYRVLIILHGLSSGPAVDNGRMGVDYEIVCCTREVQSEDARGSAATVWVCGLCV
jgi:hypothetical protein